jgi:two-component system cell cycle response regulator CpdR
MRATVLVVEDNERFAAVVLSALRAAGFYAICAHNAGDALRLAAKWRPIHLAVVDVSLPGMNGLRLAPLLVGLQPDMCLMIMSGCEPDAAESFCRPRNLPFFKKPIAIPNFVETVRRTISEHWGHAAADDRLIHQAPVTIAAGRPKARAAAY